MLNNAWTKLQNKGFHEGIQFLTIACEKQDSRLEHKPKAIGYLKNDSPFLFQQDIWYTK